MEYIKFMNASMIGVIAVALLILVLFQGTYIPLVPGLLILWAELGLGFAANRTAHYLTKEAMELKGSTEIEQNPIAKRMYQTGNFDLLRKVYAILAILGAGLTMMSIRQESVWLGLLVLLVIFPIFMIYDMLNDAVWIRRFRQEERT